MITRPTTDRGRATVARVLDAACALFAEKGVRATTLDEIGAAAGVGRGQLYHFFADKPDLVADVVGLQVERIVGSVRPAVDALSTADDVRNFCEAIIRLHDSSEKITQGADTLGFTLVERWNGTKWSIVPSPNYPPNPLGLSFNVLSSVACTASTNCVAAGAFEDRGGYNVTLVERFS